MKTRWDPTCRFIRTSGAIHLTGRPTEVLFNSSTEAYNEWERPKSDTLATVPFWARRMFLRRKLQMFLVFGSSPCGKISVHYLVLLKELHPATHLLTSLNINLFCFCPFKRHGYWRLTYSQAININTIFLSLSILENSDLIAIFHKNLAVQWPRLRQDLKTHLFGPHLSVFCHFDPWPVSLSHSMHYG